MDGLTDQSLRNLGTHCHSLRDVEAAGCCHFTDAGFNALSTVNIHRICLYLSIYLSIYLILCIGVY